MTAQSCDEIFASVPAVCVISITNLHVRWISMTKHVLACRLQQLESQADAMRLDHTKALQAAAKNASEQAKHAKQLLADIAAMQVPSHLLWTVL